MNSIFESTGLTINVTPNPVATQELLSPVINPDENLAERLTSYSHEIEAVGGYKAAQMSLAETRDRAFNWLGAIGKFVTTFNPQGLQRFRGVIGSVTVRAGVGTVAVSSLLDIGNRVRLVYSPIVDSELLNIQGGQLFTDWADHELSQALYGVWPKEVSGGALSDPNAIKERDSYLARFALPRFNKSTNTSSFSNLTVQIEVLGMWQLLTYPYIDLNAGDIAISTKLTDVLSANPNNGFVSTVYGHITENTETVNRQELGDRLAQAIIKETVSLPDLAGNRMLFGIYENGLPYYQPAPTEIAYQINLEDPNPFFKDYAEKYVAPWDMLPGRYLFYNNLFPGGKVTTAATGDIRTEFIETIRFTAPGIVEANGNAYGSLDSKINAKGLRGV